MPKRRWMRSVNADRRAARRAAPALLLSVLIHGTAHAQRSSEDAVAEALDAFGSTVGRQAIGLYTSDSARGFSPSQAGNLRIDGLYFDQLSFGRPANVIVRGSSVHVGIAAQGYQFPAPTGVVDYQLRTPGNERVASVLIGDATYGVAYNETDAQIPLVHDVLSLGAGFGFTRNQPYDSAEHGEDWSGGLIARWQPNDSVLITPFWSVSNHREFGEKPDVFLGTSGFPRYHLADPMGQPWANLDAWSSNFGTIARMSFGDTWLLAAGVFRALAYFPEQQIPFLSDTNSRNQGEYSITAIPAASSGSTSGEVRLSKLINLGRTRHTFYLRLTGRDSSIESGPGDTRQIGPATLTDVPQIPEPAFTPGLNTDVKARQLTPGVAYAGLWPNAGQVTLGVQKVIYHRTVTTVGVPPASDSNTPWLYSAAAAAFPTQKLAVYSSYTRGFEEIGLAPINAANRNEPVPAQVTNQVDAGLRYQLFPRLQLVTGVFQINKPYFDLDRLNVFRLVGHTRNRGVEFSLTGDVTDQINIVSGVVLIDPKVQYQSGAVVGPTDRVAIGPIPSFMSTYVQYHPKALSGLVVGATVQYTASRYAVYPNINLPAVATVGADVHYKTQLFGNNATFFLQAYNLADTYGLTPNASGQVFAFDARRFELSLVVDF
jgi:iron complex outermembrane receptor protein